MSWIKTIDYDNSEGPLRKIYDRIKGPDGRIDNVLTIHSLRPHSLAGHMTLYKNVLHHTGNSLPKWYLESLGVYVSYLNNCNYCVQHHLEGLKRLLNDDNRTSGFMENIISDKLENSFDSKELLGMAYAKKLTLSVSQIVEDDIILLRNAGYSDGEILEINQVVSYFNYVNRTVIGLGVSLDGDVLGLSPNGNDSTDEWSHQ